MGYLSDVGDELKAAQAENERLRAENVSLKNGMFMWQEAAKENAKRAQQLTDENGRLAFERGQFEEAAFYQTTNLNAAQNQLAANRLLLSAARITLEWIVERAENNLAALLDTSPSYATGIWWGSEEAAVRARQTLAQLADDSLMTDVLALITQIAEFTPKNQPDYFHNDFPLTATMMMNELAQQALAKLSGQPGDQQAADGDPVEHQRRRQLRDLVWEGDQWPQALLDWLKTQSKPISLRAWVNSLSDAEVSRYLKELTDAATP